MGQIKVSKCPIEGLYVIEPAVHGDARGYFMETYNQRDMEEAGLTMNFVGQPVLLHQRSFKGSAFPETVPTGKISTCNQRKCI